MSRVFLAIVCFLHGRENFVGRTLPLGNLNDTRLETKASTDLAGLLARIEAPNLFDWERARVDFAMEQEAMSFL
ncbi:hypothetical protein N9I65_03710 [bacterium]|nr:hypothetical protein [bacterium]